MLDWGVMVVCVCVYTPPPLPCRSPRALKERQWCKASAKSVL